MRQRHGERLPETFYSVDRVEGDQVVLIDGEGRERIEEKKRFVDQPDEGMLFVERDACFWADPEKTREVREKAQKLLQTILEKSRKD